MKKKLALLLCLVLLVTALALPASADNSAAWDGSVDTSWYSAEAKTFEISTPAQLAGLAAIVSGEATGISTDSFKGKTVKLTADLDLGGVKAADGTWSGPCWKPIGKNYGNAFNGTFLGGGHKISNLYFEKSLSKLTQNIGLFANIGTNGYVEGINLVSGYLHDENANTNPAGIAGINAGTIVSCHNGADVYGESYIAGIAANVSGVIVKCSNSGTIGFAGTASRGSYYGGIAAMAKNIIANCYNTGTISVAALEGKAIYAGGIVGIIQKNYTVRTNDILFNCYSSGNIVRSASATSSGPIYGAYKSLTPRNNYFLKTDAINSGYSDGVGSAAMDAA